MSSRSMILSLRGIESIDVLKIDVEGGRVRGFARLAVARSSECNGDTRYIQIVYCRRHLPYCAPPLLEVLHIDVTGEGEAGMLHTAR